MASGYLCNTCDTCWLRYARGICDVLTDATSQSRKRQGTKMEGKTPVTPKPLTTSQKQLVKRQLELEHWKKHSKHLRSRNVITGLAIGAFVVGLCIL